MKRLRMLVHLLLLPLIGIAPLFLLALGRSPNDGQKTQVAVPLVYHDHPPSEPIPATLDPGQFKDNRIAFVAYSLSSHIRETLYQVPCYCPCNKEEGHQSLLDCFTTRHGVQCSTCQSEVFFCFLQHQRGRTPEQIRKGLSQGKAWKLNLSKYEKRFYSNGQRLEK
jgi:uncharacterized protein with PCYCGC motif